MRFDLPVPDLALVGNPVLNREVRRDQFGGIAQMIKLTTVKVHQRNTQLIDFFIGLNGSVSHGDPEFTVQVVKIGNLVFVGFPIPAAAVHQQLDCFRTEEPNADVH